MPTNEPLDLDFDQLLASKDLTYEKLATKAGVSVRTIYNTRWSVTSPTRGTIKLLTGALRVSKSQLLAALERCRSEA